MAGSAKPHGRLWTWLDERVGLAELEKLAKKKEVPVHRHTVWYYLGGMTLFLFMIQVATGILLLFYYRPSAEEAYESVQFLMAEVEFGWLIRSIHSWASNLMIFTLFIHLFSVLLLKAYRPPREVTWLSGIGLLGVAMGFGFTGYLLPWNELAYFATKVGTEITGVVPLVGPFLGRLLRGGDEVTGATLTRFYGIHVAVLPLLVTALLGLHLFLVQKQGMSVPPVVDSVARMIQFVLDTDTCVFWLKGHRSIERRILDFGVDRVAISVITACELMYGAWKSARREENLQVVHRLQATVRTLHTSDEVSQLFGRWKAQLEGQGSGLDDADLLIAAITHAHHATLVTNNQAHFARLSDLPLENWLT